jgi:hypothetical protein
LVASSATAITKALEPYDPETRIALRHAVALQSEAQGIQAQASELPGRRLGEQNGSYWLRRLGVHGPIALKSLEAKLTAAGLEPGLRIEIKCEAIEQGWLSPMLGYWVNAASELATDDATVDHGPEPLSVEMRALYRRANLAEDRAYTPQEVDEALQISDLDATQRIAIRQELHSRRQLRASGLDTLAKQLTALHVLQRRLQRL